MSIDFKRLHKIARQKDENAIRAALAEVVVWESEIDSEQPKTKATRLLLAQIGFAKAALTKGLNRLEQNRRFRTIARANLKIRQKLKKKELEQKMFEQTAKALVADALKTAKAATRAELEQKAQTIVLKPKLDIEADLAMLGSTTEATEIAPLAESKLEGDLFDIMLASQGITDADAHFEQMCADADTPERAQARDAEAIARLKKGEEFKKAAEQALADDIAKAKNELERAQLLQKYKAVLERIEQQYGTATSA